MIEKIYSWFHKIISKPQERTEYSRGPWQALTREKALGLCRQRAGNLLEIGCGEGLFLCALAQNSPSLSVYGLDSWPQILLKAKERIERLKLRNAGLVEGEARFLPFRDNFFDTVACVNVFLNLASDESFYSSLKEMMRVCKKGGRVIFDIRNNRNPLLVLKYSLARYYDYSIKAKNLSLRTYDPGRVAAYMRKNNFKLRDIFALGFPTLYFAPIIVITAEKL